MRFPSITIWEARDSFKYSLEVKPLLNETKYLSEIKPPNNQKSRWFLTIPKLAFSQVDSLLKKITKYTSNPDFTPEAVGKVSAAAKGLCLWVRAMETYGYVSKEVGPKKEKLKAAQATLAKKQAALQAARDQLAAVSRGFEGFRDRGFNSVAFL